MNRERIAIAGCLSFEGSYKWLKANRIRERNGSSILSRSVLRSGSIFSAGLRGGEYRPSDRPRRHDHRGAVFHIFPPA